MASDGPRVLTLNGGASSLKFALFDASAALERVLEGKLERIGSPQASLAIRRPDGDKQTRPVSAADQHAAVGALVACLERECGSSAFDVAGHRIVHGGGRFVEPCVLTAQVREGLHELAPLDPEHLPFELELVESVERRWPELLQIACFDTAFHHELPRVAQLLPLPRRYFEAGVRRFGFHGLSCTFVLDELERTAGRSVAASRLVIAHLGSGASLTAVAERRSVDTTMAFTPASGVPMATRSGDLDPGIAGYLARTEGMDSARFDRLVHRESGLLGISGGSSDIRDLLERAPADPFAEEALDCFCYEIAKRIAGLAVALGGLDGIVFTAGIGENSAPIRARICARLAFLGVQLDPAKNAAGAPLVSSEAATVRVRVIRTNEELVLAEAALRLFDSQRRARVR